MDADGSNTTQLTYNSADDAVPYWSPDGRRIAFHSDRDGDLEIYVMDADGSNVTQLTHNPADDFQAHWPPDGEHFVFLSERDGDPEIYVMDTDGSNVTQLTHNDAVDWAPQWSPTGESVVVPPPAVSCEDTLTSVTVQLAADGAATVPPRTGPKATLTTTTSRSRALPM